MPEVPRTALAEPAVTRLNSRSNFLAAGWVVVNELQGAGTLKQYSFALMRAVAKVIGQVGGLTNGLFCPLRHFTD